MDDNGDLVPNGILDGILSSRVFLGSGVLLAGDDPIIGSISPPSIFLGDSFELTLNDVTGTGAIANVTAVVFLPDGSTQELVLSDQGDGTHQATISGLDPLGVDVSIIAFAEDVDSNVSLPAATRAITDIISRFGFE